MFAVLDGPAAFFTHAPHPSAHLVVAKVLAQHRTLAHAKSAGPEQRAINVRPAGLEALAAPPFAKLDVPQWAERARCLAAVTASQGGLGLTVIKLSASKAARTVVV